MTSYSPQASVCSDSVLDSKPDVPKSNSNSPAHTHMFISNFIHPQSDIPWFVDTEKTNFQSKSTSDFTTSIANDPIWDYPQTSLFPPHELAYFGDINADIWMGTDPQPFAPYNFLQNSLTCIEEEQSKISFDNAPMTVDEDQRQALIRIAMPSPQSDPFTTTTRSPFNSPSSPNKKTKPTTKHCSSSFSKPGSSKRRKSIIPSSSITDSDDSPTEHHRNGHNAIEKRYRNNLNAKIFSLGQCLPVPEDEDEPRKNSKAAVLSSAVKHIGILEGENRRLKKESEEMERRVKVLERLVLVGKELG